ncbi:MAG: ankyrin repeat domain-containing protein [Sedimentisphaerales bacterium]|nr:ankyrin repeat domain-containing protein [Sedimentisphaerales bacterium]
MLKRSIIIASAILALCLTISYPACRGRLILKVLTKTVENRDVELTKKLLEKNVNVNRKLSNGMTLLHKAVIPETPTNFNIVKLLLEKGANVNAVGGDFDSTALQLAIMRDHNDKCPDPEIVKLLLEYGANANAKDKLGFRPLQMACANQCVEVIKLLFEYGADINMCTQDGSTLLHLTSFLGNPNITELLLNNGVDVSSKDKKGNTALDIATEKGYTDIAYLIKVHGGKSGAELNESGR